MGGVDFEMAAIEIGDSEFLALDRDFRYPVGFHHGKKFRVADVIL